MIVVTRNWQKECKDYYSVYTKFSFRNIVLGTQTRRYRLARKIAFLPFGFGIFFTKRHCVWIE